MSKIIKRLLTFFIGLPLILSFAFFDFYYHLPMNVLIVLFSVLGANEFYNMVSNKIKLFPKPILISMSALLPFFSYFLPFIDSFAKFDSWELVTWLFAFFILCLMAIESLHSKDFVTSIEKIALSMLLIFYCGYMMTFISRLTAFEYATHFIVMYFIMVFMCDSGAWFFGVLFGKNNRGFFKASPNKSIVGFFGGIITDVACAILLKLLFTDIFSAPYWAMVLTAILTAVAAIVGDLIESVFKRSCDVKDSGNLIPGRGGALDCLDSLLLGAPVFYICVHFFFV